VRHTAYQHSITVATFRYSCR